MKLELESQLSFLQGGCCNATLGGGPSILLRYRDVYEIVVLLPFAFFRQGERFSITLGGARSVQVSYGGLCKNYSIFLLNRKRTNCRLEGGCSILLSYGRILNF